jgi:hypothetical protein
MAQFIALWNASSIAKIVPVSAINDNTLVFYDSMHLARNGLDLLLRTKHRCENVGWEITRNGTRRAGVPCTPTCSVGGDCALDCAELACKGEDRYLYALMINDSFDGYSGLLCCLPTCDLSCASLCVGHDKKSRRV